MILVMVIWEFLGGTPLLALNFLLGEQKLWLPGQFSKFLHIFFYMGLRYVDFTFAFDTPLIRLEMTEIIIWRGKNAYAILQCSLTYYISSLNFHYIILECSLKCMPLLAGINANLASTLSLSEISSQIN